jgi:hypothetical protein
MMTGRKRWWRAVALAAVGGGVIGGWFGLVRPQLAKADKSQSDEPSWTRSSVSTRAPSVAEVRTTEPAPQTGPVVPVSATLPIPTSGNTSPVAPAIPLTTPVVLVPSAPLPVPALGLPEIEPVAGPRVPDAGLISTDRPAIPAVPSLPPAELPAFPTPPKTPEVKPVVSPVDMVPMPPAPVGIPPMPAVPLTPPSSVGRVPAMPPAPLPMTTEPPKAAPFAPTMPTVPVMPPSGVMPPVTPVAPPAPVLPTGPVFPQPGNLTLSPSPVKPATPVQPVLPAKPNSDLKPSDPPNTLNPTVSPVAPATPITPPPTVRDMPGTVVDRPKPVDSNFGSADKFVFPVPVKPVTPSPAVPTPRDDTMSTTLSTTAAFAVLGGAIFAIEKANAFPTIPPSSVIPAPGLLVKADDKMDIEKLKTDLTAANKKIEDLEKQIKRLTELLTGKRDDLGLVVPSDPGAVEEIKRLKNTIAELDKELKSLKTQTSLRPTVTVPEAKPKGIVKVVNEYPVEISMVINDKSYRVAPNTKIDVEVPAGDFSYQLLQSGAAVTKSVIKDKETVTLRIK